MSNPIIIFYVLFAALLITSDFICDHAQVFNETNIRHSYRYGREGARQSDL